MQRIPYGFEFMQPESRQDRNFSTYDMYKVDEYMDQEGVIHTCVGHYGCAYKLKGGSSFFQ